MKGAVFYGPGNIKIEDVDEPKLDKHDVLVKVKVSLTCGTDLKTYRRGHPLIKPPVVLGHEFAGVIESKGSEVGGFNEGDRVVATNTGPCYECYFCKIGKHNLCEKLDESIIGFTHDGSYAQLVRVPYRVVRANMVKIPEWVKFEEAAFLEPLSCVIHGLSMVNFDYNDTVLILGSGPIGLLHLQVVKSMGVKKVIVADPNDSKLNIATKLGADYVINVKKEDLEEDVLKMTNGIGADKVIEAVGRVETWQGSIKLVRRGGKVLLFGGCPKGTEVSFDTYRLHYDELTLLGAFHYTPADVRKAFSLIESGKLSLTQMITETVSLSNLHDAFEKLSKGQAIKIAIKP